MNNKDCTICNKEFPATVEYFTKNSKCKNGVGSYCKSCQKRYRSEYFQKNKEKELQQSKSYYHNNIEQNREEYRDRYRKWYKKNQKKIQVGQTILRRNKRRNNLKYRLACNLRNRLNKFLKKIDRSESTMSLLGCDLEYLTNHLANQFTIGMVWDNYGKWHIDHIRPISSFDLSDPAQTKECFHYSNLQPLWAIDNLKKSDLWEPDPKDV